jgi:hypothetical protein
MRENTNNQIVAGSLGAVARKNGTSIATGFMNVKAFVMVDVSGSMMQGDAGNGRTRYKAACEQLEQLQNANPGEIAVGAFSNNADFCPAGVPLMQGCMTDMVAALNMMFMADNSDIRLVLISDGEPDDEKGALAIASKFKSKIDTIFVGSETGPGRKFLKDLAAATGGIAVVNKVSELGSLKDNITRLITA